MLTRKEIEEAVVRYLREKAYKTKLGINIYKEYSADILAESRGEINLIEIKTKRDDILSSLVNSNMLRSLPGVKRVYLAMASDLFQEDIIKIAQYVGFGLYKVSKEGVIDEIHAQELPQASLQTGGGYPSYVLPNQIFEVSVDFIAQRKIVPNISVYYLPAGPFSVPPGEKDTLRLDELRPDERFKATFKIKVNQDAKPGKFPLFIVRNSGVTPLDVSIYQIEVVEETGESTKQEVRRAVETLEHALKGNIENILSRIDRAMMTGIIDIRENIIDESVWNDIGVYCIDIGLYAQAELVYRKMLETIRKFENKNTERLHKGLALHNLGVALYKQGKNEEAKQKLLEAREEDRLTYGSEEAKTKPAQKTLTQLLRESNS